MELVTMEGLAEHKWAIAGTILLLIFVRLVVGFLRVYLWKPQSIRKAMEAQGISGPVPRLITGNLLEIEVMKSVEWTKPIGKPGQVDHDYVSHLFPHYKAWTEQYGPKFLIWWGEEPAILETNLDLVLEVFGSKFDGAYGKHSRQEVVLGKVIGQGLAIVNGKTWFKRRHLTQPAFHADKVKELVWPMITSTQILLEKWDRLFKECKEQEWTLDIAPEMVQVAADIISRAAFQSSYKDSNGAFEKQLEFLRIAFESMAWSFIPFQGYFPTKRNIRQWQLKSQIGKTLSVLIEDGVQAAEANKESTYVPKDLLGLLLAANKDPENVAKGLQLSFEHLKDEIKTFFAAGFDTLSSALMWTMLCLADNPIWQERVYEEIKEMCGDEIPNATQATRLKVLGMVVQEAMRLYPPAPQLARTATKGVQLGNITVPKGLSVFICIPLLHRLPEVWGNDSNEFKPERFKDGVAQACSNPSAWMPFSFGPRSCVAKNFALLEVRIVLSMIIQKFKFTVSPTYLHNPNVEGVVLKARDGVPLIIAKRNRVS